jgi:uncharacterized protein YjcR
MQEIDILIERLMEYFGVTRLQDLGEKLGVAQNTISGWRARNAVEALKKRMIEKEMKLDIVNQTNTGNSFGNVAVNLGTQTNTTESANEFKRDEIETLFEEVYTMAKRHNCQNIVRDFLYQAEDKIRDERRKNDSC